MAVLGADFGNLYLDRSNTGLNISGRLMTIANNGCATIAKLPGLECLHEFRQFGLHSLLYQLPGSFPEQCSQFVSDRISTCEVDHVMLCHGGVPLVDGFVCKQQINQIHRYFSTGLNTTFDHNSRWRRSKPITTFPTSRDGEKRRGSCGETRQGRPDAGSWKWPTVGSTGSGSYSYDTKSSSAASSASTNWPRLSLPSGKFRSKSILFTDKYLIWQTHTHLHSTQSCFALRSLVTMTRGLFSFYRNPRVTSCRVVVGHPWKAL